MCAFCKFTLDSGGSVRGRILPITIPHGSCPERKKKKKQQNNKGGSFRRRRSQMKAKWDLSPLTRKLPFAQVLGFALLAARHVGLVAAFQLSSHWEIRSYKVDSK